MAGMFNRFVWIWPSWDNGNHETEYSKSTQGLGWFTPRANESYFTEKKAFCQCQKVSSDTMHIFSCENRFQASTNPLDAILSMCVSEGISSRSFQQYSIRFLESVCNIPMVHKILSKLVGKVVELVNDLLAMVFSKRVKYA